jgi:3-oxoacyl-[acyl-carrier protein] reductase
MTDDLLAGRVALVTGGAIGIGSGIARALARAGASVAISWHRHSVEGKELVSELENLGCQAMGVEIDLSSSNGADSLIGQAVDQLGALDILVNNAGGLISRQPAQSMTDDLWNQVLALNLSSAFYCARAALPHLRDGGRIINISSLAAFNGGGAGNTAYAAAKAGMLGLTRALAKEVAGRQITVNALAPGLVLDTPFHAEFTPPAAQQNIVASLPLSRAGSPADIASAALWLCSTGADWVTGEVINLNGGQYFV